MSKFTDGLSNLGWGAAGTIVNTGLGLMLEGHNDRRQLRQQQNLQNMQIAGQKQMTDYNMKKQIEMWDATNYEAQMRHIKNAGLNPALMYGMGGGGGTTASIAQGNVSGSEAPKGGREQIDIAGMGIQMKLLQAQKENIEADTKLKLTDAEKTSGVDTEETSTRIQELQQGIDNKRQQFEIGKLEITLKNIENFEKQASQGDRLDYIEYQTKIAIKQLDNVTAEAFINKNTINEKIKIIQQTAIGAVLQNILTGEQTKKIRSDIQVNNKLMNKWTQEIMMGWDQMTQTNKEIMIKKLQQEWNTDEVRHATDQMIDAINGIMHMTKHGTTINKYDVHPKNP